MSIKERLKTAFESAKTVQKELKTEEEYFPGCKAVEVASTFVFSLIKGPLRW